MKAILMSIKPQHVANILNGLKTIEIRKKFPSDYVGWVYIYVTKGKDLLSDDGYGKYYIVKSKECKDIIKSRNYHSNGKVVARFWCDKVGRISNYPYGYEMYLSGSILTRDIQVMKENEICAKACLTKQELRKYIPCDKERYGYAIHINNIEIFDKPKELYDLKTAKPFVYTNGTKGTIYYPLTYAPQNWQYIEVQE